jgi:hypothetical protein
MSPHITLVGLPVRVASAEEVVLAPGPGGGATLNGSPIASLAHLPGGLAVIECGEQLVIMPWALLAQLLGRAASAQSAGEG